MGGIGGLFVRVREVCGVAEHSYTLGPPYLPSLLSVNDPRITDAADLLPTLLTLCSAAVSLVQVAGCRRSETTLALQFKLLLLMLMHPWHRLLYQFGAVLTKEC